MRVNLRDGGEIEMSNPQVGEFWRDREGNVIEIVSSKKGYVRYPIGGIDSRFPGEISCYTAEGKFYTSERRSMYDLIEKVEPPCTQ